MKLLLREGRTYILILAVLSVVLYLLWPPLSVVPVVLFGFLLFFFRDPVRKTPAARKGVLDFVSPADGRVTACGEVRESYAFMGSAQMVTIFLSPLDVHVNRAPITGVVDTVQHVPGQFRPAYIADAPSVNERNYLVIRSERAKCLVVQIVGVLARRVVCWAQPGQSLVAGEHFGLMKFGSCIQVFMPQETRIAVKPGDRVRGGETIIGELYDV